MRQVTVSCDRCGKVVSTSRLIEAVGGSGFRRQVIRHDFCSACYKLLTVWMDEVVKVPLPVVPVEDDDRAPPEFIPGEDPF
jgi:hypothetical protein